jgi:hypothetical protein
MPTALYEEIVAAKADGESAASWIRQACRMRLAEERANAAQLLNIETAHRAGAVGLAERVASS